MDMTGISGADHQGDGRGFSVLDFDQDGWQDIVLYSTNYPRIKLLKNQMGHHLPNRSRIQVKLEGSNRSGVASNSESARDCIGSVVAATYQSGRRQLRRLSAGEGNVAQNSSLLWFGQTEQDPVVRLDAKWPTGKSLTIEQPNSEGPILMVEP